MSEPAVGQPAVVVQRLHQRLSELRRELRTGETRLRELREEQLALEQTVLRISGAVQVLEELLSGEAPSSRQPAQS